MPDPPARFVAALADRYRIVRELGQGGMATVYLAEDLKHDRQVALKVLKPELAAVLGADRFVQEIKTTAQLQHPHILPLFDSGEADGFLYYVMPYVEGETLRDKLNQETQLSIEEAVRITVEVAEALQYAHEQGVVHRDIKPENILLPRGLAMVADFGIALALSAAAGGRMTETGLSLGTPHYMSPEQATADRNVGNRSDVYSLGSVLYEMLTGDPPHIASSAQAIIAKIVTDLARPVTDMRKAVPPNVAAAVAKSLEKLPADRFDSAGAFAAALRDPNFTAATTTMAAARLPTRRSGAIPALVALLALTVGAAAWGWLRSNPEPPTTRAWIGLSLIRPGGALYDGWSQNLALAPDGSAIVFSDSTRARGAWQLFLKEEGSDTAAAIPGTVGGRSPFFSPDGKWIGFVTGRGLFKVPRNGGAPVQLSDSTEPTGLASGVWLDDGTIVFPDRTTRRLLRIDADGSHQRVVLPARPWDIVRLEPLPQGRGVLVTTCGAEPCSPGRLSLLDLRHGRFVRLLSGVSSGWYLRTGDILYGRPDGTLFAQRCDLDRDTLMGAAIPVMKGLDNTGGLPSAVVSSEGTILYALRSEAGAAGSDSRLVWLDRHGAATVADSALPLPGSAQQQFGVSISPDGSRLAFVENTEDGQQIFVQRLPDGAITRLTSGRGSVRPEWSPDSRDLLFITYRNSGSTVARRQRADGADTAKVIVSEARSLAEVLSSPDGHWVVYRTDSNTPGGGDILARRLSGDTTTISLLAMPAFEAEPAISPDGRWLAYISDEGGTDEVYVRPWPDVHGGKWQVSQDGGTEPVWNPDGRELYYRSGGQMLMAVHVDASASFHASQSEPLFSVASYVTGGGHAAYAVSRDGRFLFGEQIGGGGGASRLILVRHWFTELRPLLKGN